MKVTVTSNCWKPNWIWEPYNPYPWVYPRSVRVKPRRKKAPVRRHKTKRRSPVRKGQKETYVTLVLDRSTSMSSCYDAALDAINEQIETIRENAHKGGKTYVSLVLFSDVIDVLFENVPAAEVTQLERADYRLMGCTALRDAMMTAIDVMEPKQDSRKNQGFLVILISDGQENSSGTTREQLQRRIEECESSDAWTFTYMLDGHSWEQIQEMSWQLSTPIGNMVSYTSSAEGTRQAGLYASNAVASYMDFRSVGETSTDKFYHDSDGSSEVNASEQSNTAEAE